MKRRTCLLVAAVMALGCGTNFESSDTTAGGGGTHPGGAGGTAGGGTGAGGTGGGGGMLGPCVAANSIDTLVDSFGGNALSELWEPWGDGEFPLAVINGALHLNPSTEPGGVRSAEGYDLRRCQIVIDLKLLPHHDTQPVEAWFELKGDGDGDHLSIYVRDGQVGALVSLGGAAGPPKLIPYEESNNRYWRFRERDGETAIQIASAGGQFNSVATVPTPAFAKEVAVELGTRRTGLPSAAVGQFAINGVNDPM